MHIEQDSLSSISRPPCPLKHPPMTVENRAAQFAPFSALTGLEDALESTSQSLLTPAFILEDEWETFS